MEVAFVGAADRLGAAEGFKTRVPLVGRNALGRAEPAGGGSGAISSAQAYDLAPFWRIIVSFA